MIAKIYRLYFVPDLTANRGPVSATGGIKRFATPHFASKTDWHFIYKAPLRAQINSVIIYRPCTLNGRPAFIKSIGPLDLTFVRDIQNNPVVKKSEVVYAEASEYVDAPKFISCALSLAEKWLQPLARMSTAGPSIIKNPDIFLDADQMSELIQRTPGPRKKIAINLAICFLWEVWHKKEMTIKQAAGVLRSLKIDVGATEENLRKKIKRLGLPPIK